MTKDEAIQQALVALGEFGYHGSSPRWERAVNDLRTALEQPPLPVQEPTQWRDMVVVSLVREGINKHRARELADHFAAQPVQEPVGEVVEVNSDGFRCEFNRRLAVGTKLYIAPPPPVQEPVACRFCHSEKGCWAWQCYKCGEIDDVQQPALPLPVQESVSMRMPKVGDKVICLEDESLGEVVSLTAGGSPDILFADGSHGTYLLREFAELFGYVTSLLPVQPEPVTWDKPSASFNEWWDGDRRRDNANPFTTDSFAYWAWEGWQAALAQRPWQGLTDEEIFHADPRIGTSDSNVNPYQILINARAIEAKLKERNT